MSTVSTMPCIFFFKRSPRSSPHFSYCLYIPYPFLTHSPSIYLVILDFTHTQTLITSYQYPNYLVLIVFPLSIFLHRHVQFVASFVTCWFSVCFALVFPSDSIIATIQISIFRVYVLCSFSPFCDTYFDAYYILILCLLSFA